MKKRLGPKALMYPIPIVLVGTLVDGQPNYTLVGDCALMGLRVPLVCISLAETHHATKGVLGTHRFSINIPSTDLLDRVDCCGLVSGAEYDKSALFTTFFGELPDVPLIDECQVSMECEVIHDHLVENRHMFIATVRETHVEESCLLIVDGKPSLADLKALDPILYGLDNGYYRIGAPIGEGYRVGKSIMQSLPRRP